MKDQPHPHSLQELEPWRRAWGVTMDEARQRFVQFIALESIASAVSLRDLLSFKGGNALRFMYGNPRGTADLDFTADKAFPDEEQHIRSILNAALMQESKRFGVKLKCQRVERKPPKKQATLPTYDIGIGFQLPGDRYFADYENPARLVPTVVNLEISFNDVVCETERRQLSSNPSALLRVCSLEDILAEKLRALLQQVIRNRTRPQDAFDIAHMLRKHDTAIDRAKIAVFLQKKCAARGIAVSRSAYANEEVKIRASQDYDRVLAVSQTSWIPFADAWQEVLNLVATLAIPE